MSSLVMWNTSLSGLVDLEIFSKMVGDASIPSFFLKECWRTAAQGTVSGMFLYRVLLIIFKTLSGSQEKENVLQWYPTGSQYFTAADGSI